MGAKAAAASALVLSWGRPCQWVPDSVTTDALRIYVLKSLMMHWKMIKHDNGGGCLYQGPTYSGYWRYVQQGQVACSSSFLHFHLYKLKFNYWLLLTL